MNFGVYYGDPDELLQDAEAQLAKGGFLVRVEPPGGLALFSPARLRLAFAGREVLLDGQVVQAVPGVGVALALAPSDALDALVADARARTGAGGPRATHAIEDAPDAAATPSEPEQRGQGAAVEAHLRVREAGRAEKIKMARYGNRDERMLIMRGTDRALQRFVVENPGLTLDEVRTIAGMPTLSAELLDTIAKRTEWSARPDVALALVRNPKTPVPVAVRMLSHVSTSDLRQIAKSTSLRMPILQAARKRVVGA